MVGKQEHNVKYVMIRMYQYVFRLSSGNRVYKSGKMPHGVQVYSQTIENKQVEQFIHRGANQRQIRGDIEESESC